MTYSNLAANDFKIQLENDVNPLLIDVRENYEFEEENIGGINIPMGDVLSRLNDLKDNTSIYICCKSGKRSQAVAYHLAKHINSCRIYSLNGGIEAYKEING